MGRSILTEEVSRRGYHLSREYSVDPLEILFVREVMRSQLAVVDASMDAKTVAATLLPHVRGRQRLFPVVGPGDRLAGVLTRTDVESIEASGVLPEGRSVVVAHPDENLRTVVYRMAETGLTRFPVVERGSGRLLGIVALSDLLKARARNLDAERRRERVIEVRFRARRAADATRRIA
jgi:CBS domain-containing protein